MIMAKMRKYEIQTSILTMLGMMRWNLVTTEKVQNAAEGKLKNDIDWKNYEGSINDDLEKFLIKIKNQRVKKEETAASFFTPKLTNEQLKLVQIRDEDHLKTYGDHSLHGFNPDVAIKEMKRSDSKSKYVHTNCRRSTYLLTLEQSRSKPSADNSKSQNSSCCNIS